MIIILKKQAEEAKINALKKEMEEQGLGIHESEGVNTRILGLVGDTSVVDMRHIMANSIVENVQRIQEPYKKANRKFHPNDTVVDVNGVKIGGGNFQVIAGPCSIETKEQITEVANDVKNSGAGLLRGGAFKPRTSPYSFQGLHGEGLELLLEEDAVDTLKKELLPIATVITPNIPEAEILCGMEIHTEEDMEAAAKAIYEDLGCAVLLKGGHNINDANDLLYTKEEVSWFKGKRINNPNTHGTGCTLSSAIAANLAKGFDLKISVQRAKDYISRALADMLDLGAGSGPMNHAFDLKDEWKEEA